MHTHTQTLAALLTRDTSATHAHVPGTHSAGRKHRGPTHAPRTAPHQEVCRSTLEPRTTHTTSVHSRAHKKGHTHPETQSTHTQVQMHTQKPGEPDTHTSVPQARMYKPPHHSLLHSPSHHTHTRTHTCTHARAHTCTRTHTHAHTHVHTHTHGSAGSPVSGASPERLWSEPRTQHPRSGALLPS